MDTSPLVSVIVPVFNGADTIAQTLDSIQAQTHRQLEILVVDDGSTDATAAIVLRHAAADPRIRLIRQPNGGVAAARNRAIAEASGAFVAPVDADDLWLPDKLRLQVQALEQAGPQTLLAYTWSSVIDMHGQIIEAKPGPLHEGDVIAQICAGNFIGNGSAALMRTALLREVGGYDTTLRARGAQGAEDMLLYFRLARRGHFAVVAQHLTQYRRRPASMSSQARQMLRSWNLVTAEMLRDYPALAPHLKANAEHFLAWLYHRTGGSGRRSDRLFVALHMVRARPQRVLGAAMRRVLLRCKLTPG